MITAKTDVHHFKTEMNLSIHIEEHLVHIKQK